MRLRWIKLWLLLALLLFNLPTIVNAHAYLERSSPLQDEVLMESPTEVRIQFTEEFNTKLSQITLEDEKGNLIDGELSAADPRWLIYTIPELDNGVYKVKWQVLSVDTHVTEGSFRFSVNVPLEKEKPSETISLDAVQPSPAPPSEKPITEPPQDKPDSKPMEETSASNGSKPPAGATPTSSSQTGSKVEKEEATATATSPVISPKEEPAKTGQALTSASEADTLETPQTGQEITAQQQEEAKVERKQGEAAAVSSSVEELNHHTHHSSAMNSGELAEWHALLHSMIRVFDVLIATIITGFLFFRYVIWGIFRQDPPNLFSMRNERVLYVFAFVGFAVSGAFHILMLAEQISEFGTDTIGNLLRTVAGSTTVGQLSFFRLIIVIWMFALTFAPKNNERTVFAAKVASALGLIVLFPLTGHAYGSSSGMWIAILSHTLHMTVAASWFGGLCGIWIEASASTRDRFTSHFMQINVLVKRFSAIALPLILTAAVSGIALSLMRLNGWSEFFASDYGQLVIAKTGLLALVIAIGAFHRFVFIPRMTAAAADMPAASSNAMRTFVFGVRMEIILAVVLFILAGILSTTSPPEKNVMAEPVYWHVMGEQAHMTFRMNSGATEGQSFRLDTWLPTGTGAPKNVNVQMMKPDEGEALISIPFEFRRGGPDPYGFEGFDKFTYEADGNIVTDKGEWNVVITITDSNDQVYRYEKTITVS